MKIPGKDHFRKEFFMSDTDMRQELDGALASLQALQSRVAELERNSGTARIPQTSLLSESFLKRAFTIWGHNFVAGIIIAIPIWLVILVIIVMAGVLRY